MAKNFEVLGEMASRNLDIRMSTQLIGVKSSAKKNGECSMMIDHKTATEMAFEAGKFYTILLIVDANQYAEIAKELDSANKL